MATHIQKIAVDSGPISFNPRKFVPLGTHGIREGTPVISFSISDTDALTGRIGLALVGKFSHSIPSSHNINKALGNIAIRGTLKWNFLNATHILIELSESDDYEKLLHGVNGFPI